jgi:hypothetical protein
LVARLNGVQEAAGSSPATPTFSVSRRRTQVVKGLDCKSSMRRFESDRRLFFGR